MSDSGATPADGKSSRHCPHGGSQESEPVRGIMKPSKFVEHADDAAALLSLLANGKRLVIIEQLLETEMSVGAIAERVSLSQSALSQHLAKLRSLNLVETRRDRQMIYYSCKSDAARRLLGTLEEIFIDGHEY